MIMEEKTRPAEFLVSEANGSRSRAIITVAHSKDLPPGTVLGQVTASGKYKQYDPAATDGSETAAAVLYGYASASAGDVQAVVIARDAEVVRRALAYASGISAANKNAAVAALEERGIISR